ncbi:MAG: T9SS type A sorting domain-containing protein, partial [Bacteroidia bacterium]|nr:T9SS type A sorting domain-containing protein [Bacteroidia bacterium]
VENSERGPGVPLQRNCGTHTPHGEWETWSEEKLAEVEKQNADLMKNYKSTNGKQMVQYTIPVVFHIIHTGTAPGASVNISQAQITDQLNILNNDFKSAGLNNGNCPSSFLSVKADAEITFCLATKNPTGGVLAEPGIDRKPYTSITGLAAPGSGYTQATIDATIKPQTIWNPTLYCNIWVLPLGSSLLGYATFPAGTTLTGLSGPYGSATTDGVVIGWQFIGSIGSASLAAPYNKGRTVVHELGHWLGLRHINGDATCGNDFVADTPTQDQLHGGCIASSNTYHAGVCSGTAGEMTMNYMDYTDDACMYMWSTGQKTRIQQCMVQGTYRSQLSASSTTLCTAAAPQAPVSNFNLATTVCTGTATTPSNGSTGNPTPTYSWSSSPAGGVTFNPNSTATAPSITFGSSGTYTITCRATNSLGVNNSTKVIVANTCSVALPACNDTLTNLLNTDTLTLYTGGGYVGGNNSYGDKEKAEYYSSAGLVGTSRVMGGIVIFYRHASANIGTKGTSSIVFKMYNGNNTSGPSGAAINTFTNTINNILTSSTATNNVNYCGDPMLAYSTNIMRPYSFNFPSPTNITGDFLIGCTTSTLTGDTIGIFSSTGNTSTFSTAWELQTPSTWVKFNDGTTTSWQLNASLAILPKLACITDVYNVNGISGNIAIFPNPSNGMFNFAVTMPTVSDLNFTVTNSIGQVVYTKVEKGVTNSIIGMNLSHLAKGIYFVNVIDSTGDKVTKKIIIE